MNNEKKEDICFNLCIEYLQNQCSETGKGNFFKFLKL
jgi:hypothetical protein